MIDGEEGLLVITDGFSSDEDDVSEFDPDDEELEETPAHIIDALGFDPAEDDEDNREKAFAPTGRGGGIDNSAPPWNKGTGGDNRARVLFEIAPDPDDAELVSRWNKLTEEHKNEVSDIMVEEFMPEVLKAVGIKVGKDVIRDQLGGYEGVTSPSYAILVRPNDLKAIKDATYLTGFVFSQKGMMSISHRKSDGASEVGLITVVLPSDVSKDGVHSIYTELRSKLGDRVGGHTTVGGNMTIADFGENSREFSESIDDALGRKYEVRFSVGYVSFPSKEDYDYASSRRSSGLAEGRSGVDSAVAQRLRQRATKRRDEEINKRIERRRRRKSLVGLPRIESSSDCGANAPLVITDGFSSDDLEKAFCPTGEGGGIDNSCPPENKGKGAKVSKRSRDILDAASKIEVRINEELDFGEIDQDHMDEWLSEAREQAADIAVDEYDAHEDLDWSEVSERAGWDRQSIVEKARDEIVNSIEGVDEDRVNELLETWYSDYNEHGEDGLISLSGYLRTAQEDGEEFDVIVDNMRSIASSDLENAEQDLVDSLSDAFRADYDYGYDDREDRAEYMRTHGEVKDWKNWSDWDDDFFDSASNKWLLNGENGYHKFVFKTESGLRFNATMQPDDSTGIAHFFFTDQDGSFDVTGGVGRESFGVIQKVTAAAVAYAKNTDTNGIHFSAAPNRNAMHIEGMTDEEYSKLKGSRKRLYDGMSTRIGEALGDYSVLAHDGGEDATKYYVVVKREHRDSAIEELKRRSGGAEPEVLVKTYLKGNADERESI